MQADVMTELIASGPVRHACRWVSQMHHGATQLYPCGQYQPVGNNAKDTSLIWFRASMLYDTQGSCDKIQQNK
jgi:hypothetical protein